MIYTYTELKDKNIDDYTIRKMIKNKELYKIDCGLYSDTKYYNHLEYIVKKYPNAIFTFDSAFFYLDFTDYIPDKYFLATSNNSKKIKNENVEQIFMSNKFFEVGKIQIKYNNIPINIYDKERMLIELVRNKNKIPFDYYKEVILNYRDISNEINIDKLSNYLDYFKNSKNIFETIQREVF